MAACIFCDIIEGRSQGQIYFEDEDMLVLKDINPVNVFHILAISKEHIRSESELLPKHKNLVKKLIENGERVMAQIGAYVDDMISGFHRDPFLTVHHLHLHFVSPSTNLYFDQAMYGDYPSVFITGDDVLARLENETSAENPTSDAVEAENAESQQSNCNVS